MGENYVVTGSGIFLGQSGNPTSIGPVSLRTVNQYQGLYALDTFNVTDAFAITGGGRFNHAQVTLEDQLGTALNGDHTYDRFNPVIGGTYKITPELTAYAGYSEANRVPTPLELGCADPNNPCLIAAFLVSDPDLKQVVSKTVEAGFRGTKELAIGSLGWKIGGFRATNYDDILALPIRGPAGLRLSSRTSARRAGRASKPRSASSRTWSSSTRAMPSSTPVSSMRSTSPPTARRPSPMAASSRSCPATRSRPSRAIASKPASNMPSPMPGKSAATRSGSRASIMSATNPISKPSCRAMPCSTCTLLSGHQEPPDLRQGRQHLRQSLRDLRHFLRHHLAAELRQWRQQFQRSALTEPGKAARVLRGRAGDVLRRAGEADARSMSASRAMKAGFTRAARLTVP